MHAVGLEQQPGYLCALDDIPDGGALEIPLREVNGQVGGQASGPGIVVLRRGDDAWAYRNVCPHFSIPLNYEPNTFWAYDAELLMCAHHSAMFRFEDGMCVDGPCEGAALTPVPIRIERRGIFDLGR
jgi:nitrite reductase/ring-hydroxylating ferredoxin subunit